MTDQTPKLGVVQQPEKRYWFGPGIRQNPFWPLVRDLGMLLIIHCIGVYVMTNWRLLDQLLSPGGNVSMPEIFLAIVFLCVRMFLITFCPGWVLARFFWVYSRPREVDTVSAMVPEADNRGL